MLYYTSISVCTDERQYLMRYFQIIALVACILLPASALAGDDADYETGLNAYKQGHYKTAKDIWQAVAGKGHAGAQFYLGVIYDKGEGVPQDSAEAAEWFQKAAKQGHPEAQFHLGVRHDKGEGVLQNYIKAAKLFRRAAEQGHAEAQLSLGWMYYNGRGVPQDRIYAYAWCNLAAVAIEEGKECRLRARNRMHDPQIAEGQALSEKLFQQIQRDN